MKRLILATLIIFLMAQSIIAQERSPMYYKGVDAGMSAKKVVEILGKPEKIKEGENVVLYIYSIEGGGHFYLGFYSNKLFHIIIDYPTSYSCDEFGLSTDGGNGFMTCIDDDGLKNWVKAVKSKEFGEIIINYKSEPGYTNIINHKEMFISEKTLLKWKK